MPPCDAISTAEAKALFADLEPARALLLAVSGGPDSIALMMLVARWRAALPSHLFKRKPQLIVATVDHGLRPEAKAEAASVAKLARKLGLTHRTLRWTGPKPKTGLPQAARAVRYALLSQAARKAGASHILTAHTLDDQAETVLIRMSRGSGMTGLAAMTREAAVPNGGTDELKLLRPLLDIPKVRLIAMLRAEGISFADDPSNRDPRFTRARLRGLMAQLAQEGLDASRLALLARRLKRANAAIESAVDRANSEVTADLGAPGAYDALGFARLPDEIGLRLIGRAIAAVGDEGPVELGKLEALCQALATAQKAGNPRFRRSLAGALVTLAKGKITIERAPPRHPPQPGQSRQGALTTPRSGGAKTRAKRAKSR